MEEFVTKMVNAATMDRFVEYVRNLTTDVPSFEHQGHYSNPTIALTPDDVEFMKQSSHSHTILAGGVDTYSQPPPTDRHPTAGLSHISICSTSERASSQSTLTNVSSMQHDF